MSPRGFNPEQLVARGVFESLEEADRVLCELDEARREPRVISAAWLEGFGFKVQVAGCRLNFPAACAVGAGEPFSRLGKPVDAVPGRESESERSPESDAGAASVLCPWCAIERAMSGQGSAPRAGFVSVVRCHRHAAEPPARLLTASNSPHPAGARDAFFLAPASALPLPRSADAGPFHPTTNPNAGVVPAFPKGRW